MAEEENFDIYGDDFTNEDDGDMVRIIINFIFKYFFASKLINLFFFKNIYIIISIIIITILNNMYNKFIITLKY